MMRAFPTGLLLSSLSLLTAGLGETHAQVFHAARSPQAFLGLLSRIDLTTGQSLNTLVVEYNGNFFDGFTGMAYDSFTEEYYVTFKDGNIHRLAQVEPNTGTLTFLCQLPNQFAGIAFDNTGTLYGITGDGAQPPSTAEVLHVIDPSNCTVTPVVAGTPGTADGEAIAYHPNDGLIYRYGGGLFESIDPMSQTITPIASGLDVPNFAHALCFDPLSNSFTFAAGDSIFDLTTSGALTFLVPDVDGDGDAIKGLALVDQSTDLLELPPGPDLIILPNPADDQVLVDRGGTGGEQTLLVFNAEGRLVDRTRAPGTATFVYSTAELAPGVFTFVLSDGARRMARRVVVQH